MLQDMSKDMGNEAQLSANHEARRPYSLLQAVNSVQGRIGLFLSLFIATLVIVSIARAPQIRKPERRHQFNVTNDGEHTKYPTSNLVELLPQTKRTKRTFICLFTCINILST